MVSYITLLCDNKSKLLVEKPIPSNHSIEYVEI